MAADREPLMARLRGLAGQFLAYAMVLALLACVAGLVLSWTDDSTGPVVAKCDDKVMQPGDICMYWNSDRPDETYAQVLAGEKERRESAPKLHARLIYGGGAVLAISVALLIALFVLEVRAAQREQRRQPPSSQP